MASEAVKKILEAEAESGRKIAAAKQRREDIINEAMGSSAHTIQKRVSDAAAESEKIKSDYAKKLSDHTAKAEAECQKELDRISAQADKNMDKAVDAVIKRFF